MLPGVGIPEMMFLGIIALLLFGKKLPEVARSLGKGVIEFKKGLRSIEDELDTNTYSPRHDYSSSSSSSSSNARPEPKDESVESSAPKFEPPTSEPHNAQ